MDERLQIAEAVRQACIEAAIRAYEDAGLSGLCHEGRWEYAVDAMRQLHLQCVVQTLLRQVSPPACMPDSAGLATMEKHA
jgi:hypothetical protein